MHALVPHVLITGLITLVITDSTQSQGPIYFTGVFNNRSSRAHKYLYSAEISTQTKSTDFENIQQNLNDNQSIANIMVYFHIRNAGFHLKVLSTR